MTKDKEKLSTYGLIFCYSYMYMYILSYFKLYMYMYICEREDRVPTERTLSIQRCDDIAKIDFPLRMCKTKSLEEILTTGMQLCHEVRTLNWKVVQLLCFNIYCWFFFMIKAKVHVELCPIQ